MLFETPRLYLRKLCEEDYKDLCEILQDEETMAAYEHAFSDEEVRSWLEKQYVRYEKDGFGLWAVVLKETGEMIGQCGITVQDTGVEVLPEIGYLFKRKHWHKGYAAEAASACKEYGFNELRIEELCSIIRDTNRASQKVAEKNGMEIAYTFTKHYYGVDMPHYVYKVKRIR